MNEEDPMEGTMAKHLRKKHEEESGAGWVKPKPHPCHIIEVDCPTCSHDEWAEGCDGCSGKGRRRMAVWQPHNSHFECDGEMVNMPLQTPKGVEVDVITIEMFIGMFSPYQSNSTLPSGEKVGEVMLKTAIDAGASPAAGITDLTILPDTWLCCAYIIEEVE